MVVRTKSIDITDFLQYAGAVGVLRVLRLKCNGNGLD